VDEQRPAPHALDGSVQGVEPGMTEVSRSDFLFVQDRDSYLKVERSAIVRVVAEGKYVEIHTSDRRFVLRGSLDGLMKQVADGRLVRVNRWTAVNIRHVDRITSSSVEVTGVEVTLSRKYRANLLASLLLVKGE
jgi:two-component system, response regulator PdtaR